MKALADSLSVSRSNLVERLARLQRRRRDYRRDPPVVGKMAAHVVLPWMHRVFSSLKTWAARCLSPPRSQAPAGLPRRAHLPLQPKTQQTGRLPIPPAHRRRNRTGQLQHVDLTGSRGTGGDSRSSSAPIRPGASSPTQAMGGRTHPRLARTKPQAGQGSGNIPRQRRSLNLPCPHRTTHRKRREACPDSQDFEWGSQITRSRHIR